MIKEPRTLDEGHRFKFLNHLVSLSWGWLGKQKKKNVSVCPHCAVFVQTAFSAANPYKASSVEAE